MFSLIYVWINDWVNNREAGDLRRYRAHYDVSVMFLATSVPLSSFKAHCPGSLSLCKISQTPWVEDTWKENHKYDHLYNQTNHFIIRPSLWYGAVRPSVRSSVRPTVSTKKHRCKWWIFFKFCTQVCLGVPSINLLFVLSYLIKYVHNSIISDFSIFGTHRVIF